MSLEEMNGESKITFSCSKCFKILISLKILF
jgi:hypothetical protein